MRQLFIWLVLFVGPNASWGVLCAQVPVIREPQPFRFEYFPDAVVKTTQIPSAPIGPSIDIPSGYIPQGNPGTNPSMWMVEKYYVSPGMSPQEQVRYADEQIRAHELQLKQEQALIDEANATFDALEIKYELPFRDLPEKQAYAHAFNEIESMLKGEKLLSLERAVYLVEHAFDPSLTFAEFDAQLNKSASVIGLKMQQDKLSPEDNLGKLMTVFRFVSDTISVKTQMETTITTYPKTYDFEDFWGMRDYRKMFVSKLLREGSGQCHSLPLLFLLLCEKIDAEAHLAFAPNHSFIRFQDRRGVWHNLELTNGMLASDHFMIESGYVKAEAIQNRIYMEPLTKEQVIVQCLNDLAMGYQKKYGYDPFVKECSEVAIGYEPKSLTARQTLSNYYVALSNHIVAQYRERGFNKSMLDQDERAQMIFSTTEEAINFIEDLGYADMPPEAYAAWLESIKEEANKQQHTNEIRVLGRMIERR